ncbi:MAG: TIR domain-containing protein [Candidatus Omnitrophica bacterium]|nr:TIR domain-containing protein [Candidatus Omnitrophota bacterium]
MAMRVFIAFSESDMEEVKKAIQELAHSGSEFDFYEGPFPREFELAQAEQARRTIGEKIVQSSITVCLIGEETHRSPWVAAMLQKTLHKGNPIIAMALRKVERAVLPEIIHQENLRFYPWNPKKLLQLLEEKRPSHRS